MKRGAIFDMDGLLFDTETVYQTAWTVVADDFGVQGKQAGKAAGLCDDGGEFCLARADGLQFRKSRCGVVGN